MLVDLCFPFLCAACVVCASILYNNAGMEAKDPTWWTSGFTRQANVWYHRWAAATSWRSWAARTWVEWWGAEVSAAAVWMQGFAVEPTALLVSRIWCINRRIRNTREFLFSSGFLLLNTKYFVYFFIFGFDLLLFYSEYWMLNVIFVLSRGFAGWKGDREKGRGCWIFFVGSGAFLDSETSVAIKASQRA